MPLELSTYPRWLASTPPNGLRTSRPSFWSSCQRWRSRCYRRQIEGEDMEVVADFTFLGSMITADGDSSHEIKRSLVLGRKAMTNLDSILKSRDITLPTKVRIVKAMVFPVVMYGSESWTIKKAAKELMPFSCGAGGGS